MTKNLFRKNIKALPIRQTIFEDAVPASGNCVLLFWPLPDEVDTRPFIHRCHQSGVTVLLPVVEDDHLILRRYQGDESLKTGAFNIPEPQGETFSDFNLISKAYIPGLAFTPGRGRMGRGKGYYDRLIPHLTHAELIGVCPSGHLVDDLPMESHDQHVHRVWHAGIMMLIALLSFVVSCQNKSTDNNPAFAQMMDTTGAEDPYIYEGDSAYSEEAVTIRRVNHSWQLRQERHRTVRAPYINKEKGIISTYDNLFKSAAAQTGWDWRLIAAQCYQESGFDPNARSGAGALGLMQLMPATAREMGLAQNEIHNPSANIAAAARYIRLLSKLFSDIRDHEERIHFVLAAYNGGHNHVRDAMALCRKYGGSPQHWHDVSRYILGLQQPRYYRDPVVKHGYMIGSETASYVSSVIQRARQYGANLSAVSLPPGWKAFSLKNSSISEDSHSFSDTVNTRPARMRSTNRFTRHNSDVLRPNELGVMTN